jgi:hypothetical protein
MPGKRVFPRIESARLARTDLLVVVNGDAGSGV